MSTLLRMVSIALVVASITPSSADEPSVHTFSVVAYDANTGDLGVAVASRVLAVGAIVPYVEADVGAVATQSLANSSYGPRGLQLLKDGKSPSEILDDFKATDPRTTRRQVGIVDAAGRAASYTGDDCIPHASHVTGDGYAIQGNLLAGPDVIADMKDAFEAARESGEGELADWLMATLTAGDQAGGDKRGKQAAALIVARKGAGYGGNNRYIDLRVDDDEEPVAKLTHLLELHKKLFTRAHENPPRR